MFPRARPFRSGPTPVPPPPGVLKGQFVIQTANPLYPQYPDAKPDRFFMAELDGIWASKPAEAQRIIDAYKGMGYNHVTCGTPIDKGYHGHFPDMNWLGNPDGYADYLQYLSENGITFSLFLIPDIEPYWFGRKSNFGWDAIRRDFEPFYTHPRIQALTSRVVSQWEQYTYGKYMVELFTWIRGIFPNARRAWHNPTDPTHLSPCDGTEYRDIPGGMTSEEAWRAVAAAGCDEFLLQTYPLNIEIPPHEGNPPLSHIDTLKYDLWDMSRRFRGVDSPWGPPILAVDGKPVRISYMEGMAYYQYWNDPFLQPVAREWGEAALSVEGVEFALDGAPLV